MDERALRYFLAVVREGSIRRAAGVLNVAASAISRQIAELEAECALPLLERLPRGVAPTEAGQAVARHALQREEDTAELHAFLRQLRGLHEGMVRIRCGEGFAGDLLDNGLPPFAAMHPDIRIKLDLGGTSEVLAAVGQGEVDIGLAYNPVSGPDIRSVAVARQPLHLVMVPDHPLNARGQVWLRELIGQPVALLDETHGVRQLLRRVEADLRFRLAPRLETNSIDVLRRCAASGHAVTLLPAFVVAAEVQAGRLAARPLADRLLQEAASHILVRAQRRLPKPVERLIGVLCSGMEAFRAAAS